MYCSTSTNILAGAKKILIRSTNWIGDAVMTVPALAVIRENVPDAEITLLSNPLVSQLFSPHPVVDRVITFDRKGRHKGLTGAFRLASELWKEKFDAAIIFPNSFNSALPPFLAGIPRRLGKASDGRSLLLTHRFVPDASMTAGHEVHYYLHLLDAFGLKGGISQPYLVTTADERMEAKHSLAEVGIAEGDFILGINPGAAFGSAKRWDPDRFAETAQKLSSRWGAKIVIFGSSSEADIADEIADKLQTNCLNMAGKTSVRQLMALIERCNFFVTNDSGPMHIAASFAVPLVAIFGSTDHTGTAPFSEKFVVVRKGCDCAPCKLRECPKDHRCMNAVTADDVIQAACKLSDNILCHKRNIGHV